MDKKPLSELYSCMQENMKAKLQEANAFDHAPTKGNVTEVNWIEWLKAYAPGTFDIPGDQIAVAVNEDGTLSVTFPIGEPPVVFTYTKEQAEQIGLDMDVAEEPEVPAYTPDESKTVITFNKENGFFTISGAGKFIVSGMEADLTFTAADTYTVAEDGAVTAANTADALSYTVTMFGQSEEAKATPVTTIVKDGDNYKVTLTATVNGQTLTLAEGTVSAEDVIKSEEPEVPAITYSSAAESITFNAEGKSFSANGSGTLSAMGMDMAITFTLNDSYAVAEDGTVTATNTPGALSYSVLGTPGSGNPITSITQSGDSYRIVISTEISGFGTVTLLDETVNASNVVVNEVASVSEEEVLEDDGVEENSEEILAGEETDSEDPAIIGTQDDQAEENPDDSVSDGAEPPDTENDSDATEEVTDSTESSETDSNATEEVTDTTESSETDSDTTEETTNTTTSEGTDTEGTVPEEANVSTEVE